MRGYDCQIGSCQIGSFTHTPEKAQGKHGSFGKNLYCPEYIYMLVYAKFPNLAGSESIPASEWTMQGPVQRIKGLNVSTWTRYDDISSLY